MTFIIDDNELEQIAEWNKNHNCIMKENIGTIGGRLTYSFTPTGLGEIVTVKYAYECYSNEKHSI